MSALQIPFVMKPLPDEGTRPWLFTRALYDCAGALGWFHAGDVELLGGMIVSRATGEPRLWTRAEYAQAYELGWFNGLRVELVQGKAVVKLPVADMLPRLNGHGQG